MLELAIGRFLERELDRMEVSANRVEYLNATFVYNQVADLAANLATRGYQEETSGLIDLLPEETFRIKANLIIARKVHASDLPEHTYFYINQAYQGIDNLDQSSSNQRFRFNRNLIETFSSIGSRELNAIVDEEMSKIYPNGTSARNPALIERGKYYQAFSSIPKSNTIIEDLNDYEAFFLVDNENLNDPKWAEYKERLDRYRFGGDYIRFVTN